MYKLKFALIILILSIFYVGIYKPAIEFARFSNFNSAIVKVELVGGGHGTGFFTKWDNKTYLITAAHVCGQHKFVLTRYGSHVVVHNDPVYDTCIAEAQEGMDTIRLNDTIKLGMKVSVTGFPLSYNYRKTDGLVKSRSTTTLRIPFNLYGYCPKNSIDYGFGTCLIYLNTFEISASVNKGNSGGPVVLDGKGKVIGIVTALDNVTGAGFIIPVQDIIRVLQNMSALDKRGTDD